MGAESFAAGTANCATKHRQEEEKTQASQQACRAEIRKRKKCARKRAHFGKLVVVIVVIVIQSFGSCCGHLRWHAKLCKLVVRII